jgi:hypothetical protein
MHIGNTFYLDANGDGWWNGVAGGDAEYAFGAATDTAASGDWNGDGTDEIGVQRGVKFYLDENGNGHWDATGADPDLVTIFNVDGPPVTGDWVGDGEDRIGVRSAALFHLDFNNNGVWDKQSGGDIVYNFGGLDTDIPLAGRWAPRTTVLLAAPGQAAPTAQVVRDPVDADVPAGKLTPEALAPIVRHAIDTWSAGPLSPEQLQTLQQVEVRIVNLPGSILAQAHGTTVSFDLDAARHGWFIDSTPGLNEEFDTAAAAGLLASDGSPAAGRMDLLSAALHEIGHLVGFEDEPFDPSSDRVMNGWLDTSVRRELSDTALDTLFGNPDALEELFLKSRVVRSLSRLVDGCHGQAPNAIYFERNGASHRFCKVAFAAKNRRLAPCRSLPLGPK